MKTIIRETFRGAFSHRLAKAGYGEPDAQFAQLQQRRQPERA